MIDLNAAIAKANEAKARAERATKGPWIYHCKHCFQVWSVSADALLLEAACATVKRSEIGEGFSDERVRRNLRFIAAARQDVPEICDLLLAIANELKNERAQCEFEYDAARKYLAERDALAERVKELEG